MTAHGGWVADIFFDCEWWGQDYVSLVGGFSWGLGVRQFHGTAITRGAIGSLVRDAAARAPGRDTFIFCHGPDVGRIESHLGIDMRSGVTCVNTVTAFHRFTRFRDASLRNLEDHFKLPRREALSQGEMHALWRQGRAGQARVLAYNEDDVRNLHRLVVVLRQQYGVTDGHFRSIALA